MTMCPRSHPLFDRPCPRDYDGVRAPLPLPLVPKRATRGGLTAKSSGYTCRMRTTTVYWIVGTLIAICAIIYIIKNVTV